MNKKETSEIKKNFSDKSGFFIMERVLTAFADNEKNLRYNNISSCITMESDEHELYENILKKVLNTNIGKNFTEYEFPNEAYEDGKGQDILYKLLKSELKDEETADNFLNHIVNNISYTGAFAIITAYCTYTIRKKDKFDEFSEDNADEVYKYLLTAICPVEVSDTGFVFDSFNNEIIHKIDTELFISKAPSDGFLYPVFSNRSSDVNHIMYYSRKAGSPNISIIEDILDCKFVMSSENEKANFQNILKTVAGDELDYTLINNINEKIKETVEQNKDDTDTCTIDNNKIRNIFEESGVSQERLKALDAVYESSCGKTPLTATNLIESKTVLKTSGITVNISPSASDKVRTGVFDGRKCLLIDLDDPDIEINGLPVNMR